MNFLYKSWIFHHVFLGKFSNNKRTYFIRVIHVWYFYVYILFQRRQNNKTLMKPLGYAFPITLGIKIPLCYFVVFLFLFFLLPSFLFGAIWFVKPVSVLFWAFSFPYGLGILGFHFVHLQFTISCPNTTISSSPPKLLSKKCYIYNRKTIQIILKGAFPTCCMTL